MFESIIALLQFTTILPLGKTAPFDAFAKKTWLYPIAGYVTGGIGAIILLAIPAPPLVLAVLVTGIIFLITGCNHLDGLFDLGDGLMAHGSSEKRITAVCDRTLGTGGIALGLIITLITITSICSISEKSLLFGAVAIIIAEVGGKWSMAFLTATGRPFHDGIHATLHSSAKKWFWVASFILVIPALLLPEPFSGKVIAVILMLIVPEIMKVISYRLFGGVNGDIVGGCSEITRACMLLVMACLCA